MTSDVTLTAALRNNLLNLQQTQTLIDKTQLALATGRSVNSALDNPQSFFAAQALTDRANDLNSLLDGIGQSIQAVQAADDGITALQSLLDQAESIAANALTAIDDGGSNASITGTVSLEGDDNLTTIGSIDASDSIRFEFFDSDGTAFVASDLDTNSADATASVTDSGAVALDVNIDDNQTINEFITEINALKDSSGDQLVRASLTSEGNLKFESLTGGDFRVTFTDNSGTNAVAEGLGFSTLGAEELTDVDTNANTPDQFGITVSAEPVIKSFSLYDGTNVEFADRSDTLASVRFQDPNNSFALTSSVTNAEANDAFIISINGTTITSAYEVVSNLATATIQDLVDGVNNNANLNESIVASYNETTGQIEIRALSSDVFSVQFAIEDTDNDTATNLSVDLFGRTQLTGSTTNNVNTYDSESITFGVAAGQITQLEQDYNTVLGEIDALVADSGYRGTNLLNGDDLETFFNETRTSSLTISGSVLTSGTDGLNISEANFSSISQIGTATTEVLAAQGTVRSFSASLSNSLTILQNRESFTQNLVNTLQEGADKLTLADQNEEGAKLLSLQTRQQLGVTSLSLASQAQQSVLRLF